MEKKKYKNYIVIIIFLIILSVPLYIFNKEEEEFEEVTTVKYSILKDYSRFFTVNSCVSRYFNYLSNNNVDNLLKILDKDYILDNGINSDNIYNFVPKLDGIYSFSSRKIYYKNITDNYITYYVYGYSVKEIIDTVGEKKDYYFEVNLDNKEQLFSIKPISENVYREVENG